MSKLTLNIDKEVIAKAKEYASKQNRSLSSVIESFLKKITLNQEGNSDNPEEIKISPFVKSLSLKSTLPQDYDYKKALGEHYTEKYK